MKSKALKINEIIMYVIFAILLFSFICFMIIFKYKGTSHKIYNNGISSYEIVDYIDNDTHTLFIGKIIEADLEKDDEPMTYLYYQENKEKLLKVKTANNQTAWICTICGFIYYGEELPDDYKCPVCGVGKDMFKKVEE